MNTLPGLAFYSSSSISLGMFRKPTVKKKTIQLLHTQLDFQQVISISEI